MMAEPEPPPSSEPQAESKPRNISGKDHIPNAEPKVDLSAVSEAWQVLFKIHWISFAFCFAFLMLYNVYQLVKTYRRKNMRDKVYMSTVHVLVIILGLSRTLALCFWPYELTNNTPNIPYVIPRILYGLGFPCLFSGFTFVHKIFLKVSKIQMLSPGNLLKGRSMAVVLCVHFIAVISAEFITSYVPSMQFLLLICAFYYFIGCLGLSLSLLFSGRKVIKRTKQIEQNLKASRSRSPGFINKDVSLPKSAVEERNDRVSKVYIITATAVAFGLLGSLLYIYSLTWFFRGALNDPAIPSPWIWLVVNTFQKICELFLTITMTYAVCYNYQENTCPQEISTHKTSATV